MNYDSFLNKYQNEYWDYDHYYGPQCMDLILYYAQELALSRFSGNAADVASQYPSGWTHVSALQRGDVVVFARNAANGYAGHIAIFDSPGVYFSQNYPTRSNSHLQRINEPIIAILRPNINQGATLPYSDQQYTDLKASTINYLYFRYMGRGASQEDVKAQLGADINALEGQLRNPDSPTSEEHRARIKDLFLLYLGRPASDSELRQRTPQGLAEIATDFVRSDEHKKYLGGLPTETDSTFIRFKQALLNFINNFR